MLPPSVRQFIPLRFWPGFCSKLQHFYDVSFEILEEHNSKWKVGDAMGGVMGVLETERHNGKCTESV